jgi:hypothetical protein
MVFLTSPNKKIKFAEDQLHCNGSPNISLNRTAMGLPIISLSTELQWVSQYLPQQNCNGSPNNISLNRTTMCMSRILLSSLYSVTRGPLGNYGGRVFEN